MTSVPKVPFVEIDEDELHEWQQSFQGERIPLKPQDTAEES